MIYKIIIPGNTNKPEKMDVDIEYIKTKSLYELCSYNKSVYCVDNVGMRLLRLCSVSQWEKYNIGNVKIDLLIKAFVERWLV